MKKINLLFTTLTFFVSLTFFAQSAPNLKKIRITGTIIEKQTKQALEYATITLTDVTNPKNISGGITNSKGEFDVTVSSGNYNIKAEFISFKITEIRNRNLSENTNLGAIMLDEDATQLNEVVVRAETSTVEIKLDKKVYNVGQDLMVKGGTVSDVLDNIPSVTVDIEGNISLRGNQNVRILIDGRPSNAINIAEALRLIPADAIDKVEVVTNPSARYDAEGGGGLLNIILKKGKNNGFNGTFIASTGYPNNHGLSGTLNYKTNKISLFSTQGYNYRSNPGNSFVDTEYLNAASNAPRFINETRDSQRNRKGYNGNIGMDLFLNESTTLTTILNYRKNNGDSEDRVDFENIFLNAADNFSRSRNNFENNTSENIEVSAGVVKKFKKEGHKLNIDTQFSSNKDNDLADIIDSQYGNDATFNDQKQSRNLFQVDYVLPLGKGSQFEAGYRGDFSEQSSDVNVFTNQVLNTNFTNRLDYKEKVNALYSQYGFKADKFSFLFGLRWEDSNIDVNQITSSIFKNKRYNNFFPSGFVTYEISDKSSVSASYSRRINRPRGRMLNPFSNYSSNINIMQGNPDLNPSMTDAIDFGYIKRWQKLTFSTSLYLNKTNDAFQFVRRESGEFVTTVVDEPDTIENGQVTQVNGGRDIRIPVILSSPINLATEYRAGFEFTLNYSPYRWWKLNSNFNFYRTETQGNYVYTNFNNEEITQNFNNIATSWFSRLSSKVSLPGKMEWQTNMTYNGAERNAQGKSLGIFSANLALSKDVMKDKGTISFNISDVFNSRKRKMETNLPNLINSYSEMQWRVRQFSLSFTYRFNKPKNEKEKPRQKSQENGDNGDYQG